MIEVNKVYNMDCFKGMDKMIEQGLKVDAIITDIPYGTTACKWDSIIPLNEMWIRLNKIIKPKGAICLFGIEPFASTVRISNIKNYKHEWIWNKEQAGNFIQAKNHPLRVTENIMVFCNEKVNYYPIMEIAKEKNKRPLSIKPQKTSFLGKVSDGTFKASKNYNPDLRYPKNIITFNARSKECNNVNRVHPTQKPIELIEYLINTYTHENDLVLDFTIGSGTTAVACINTNRQYIGFETDLNYYNIALQRINNTYKIN